MNNLSRDELRAEYAQAWGKPPPRHVGEIMLKRSIQFRKECSLSADIKERLKQLTKDYKRNTENFSVRKDTLKPGVRLVRTYQGKQHDVLVTKKGFEYQGESYSSLSSIARNITGKCWNGWIFFGLKKATTS